MPDDAFTPGDAPRPRSAQAPAVSSRRITHEIDEDRAPRDRLRVWTQRTGCTLAVALIAGGIVGIPVGGGAGYFAADPYKPIVILGGGALGAALFGFVFYRSTRRLHGKGKRISNHALPTGSPALPGLPRRARADRITNQPTPPLPMPPRHVERLRGAMLALTAVAISHDGRLAAGGNRRGRVILWDVQTGFELFSLPAFKKRTTAVAFSPDGALLAAAGIDPNWSDEVASLVRVWDAASGRELRQIEIEKGLFSMRFLPDGRQLLLGGQDYLRIWELDGPSAVALIDITEGVLSHDKVRAIAVATDGKVALTGGSHFPDIWLVNLELAAKVRRLRGHSRAFLLFRPLAVTSLAFSPDGLRAVSGGLDQTARVWNVLTGQSTMTFRGHTRFWGWRGVVGVAWLPDGKRAVSASEDGTLRIWEVDTGRELDRRAHGGSISCLAVTPDGRMALTGGRDGIVRVFTLG